MLDSNGGTVATTLTDTNGEYLFEGVPAGDYTVAETNNPAYGDVSDVDGANDNTITVTLPAGGNSEDNDFVDELSSIEGTVFVDTDNDDAGDTNLSGVTITLLDSNGALVASTTTNATATCYCN